MSNMILGDFFKNALIKYGSKTALKTSNDSITYHELMNRAMETAERLVTKKHHPSEKVAILLSNSIDYVVIDLAIMFSRNTKVALNTMLSEKEIYYILKDSDATTIFIDEKYTNILKNIENQLPLMKNIIVLSNTNHTIPTTSFIILNTILEEKTEVCNEKEHHCNENEAIIAYTGGTTGYPKGAVYSHHKIYLILLSHIIELELKREDVL